MVDFLPITKKEIIKAALHDAEIPVETKKKPQGIKIEKTSDFLRIGDVSLPISKATAPAMVPNVFFHEISAHNQLLLEIAKDFQLGEHVLLIGNQGVGKNKLIDYLLQLLNREREYMQLHRDTTAHSITMRPVADRGVLQWEESGLIRGARLGRVVIVDEADKAPAEVLHILRAMAEDEQMVLPNGTVLISSRSKSLPNAIQIHKNFRMVLLANRPGFPFLGNDFFDEIGGCFSW
jgi:MoxR-like ATPase